MALDEATRVRQGGSAATLPDVLAELANDPSPMVRATLALNPAASGRVNSILAADRDERVRVLLGRKLAALTPRLNGAAHAVLRRETLTLLTALATDHAERVRASVAEAVNHMPDAPRAIILRLAADPAVMVCEPVIRFSPLLTSADLIGLIVAAPCPGTILAVARRPRIDVAVSDAIVGAARSDAIAALLANPSAQIREATLDALIAGAAGHREWQEPLAHRPGLSHRAARALSEIISAHLLEVLLARPDLDPALAGELAGRLRPAAVAGAPPGPGSPLAAAEAMWQAGQLDAHAVLSAAQSGNSRLLGAMLALMADVPPHVIERAVALRSAKGMVSLTWSAGFSMQVALVVQTVLAHLPPAAVIQPEPGGGFPMSVQEMRWQLAFLGRPGR